MTLEEQVDAAVGRWHVSDTSLTLREYLGMTQEQYAAWVCTGKLHEAYTAVKSMAPYGAEDV